MIKKCIFLLSILLVIPSAWAGYKDTKYFDNPGREWFKPKDGDSKGVFLVSHGLNLRPEQMDDLIDLLVANRYSVLLTALKGHGKHYSKIENVDEKEARLQSFREVDSQQWLADIYWGYKVASDYAKDQQLPIYYLGFSISGLIISDLMAENKDIRFEKQILLAPAISVQDYTHLIRGLSFVPNLSIPSLSHPDYRANDYTPMAGYNALFDIYNHFQEKDIAVDIPTLVLVSLEDELVSPNGIEEWIETHRLKQWKLKYVADVVEPEIKTHRHLIIARDALGGSAWKKLTSDILAFLAAVQKI